MTILLKFYLGYNIKVVLTLLFTNSSLRTKLCPFCPILWHRLHFSTTMECSEFRVNPVSQVKSSTSHQLHQHDVRTEYWNEQVLRNNKALLVIFPPNPPNSKPSKYRDNTQIIPALNNRTVISQYLVSTQEEKI